MIRTHFYTLQLLPNSNINLYEKLVTGYIVVIDPFVLLIG